MLAVDEVVSNAIRHAAVAGIRLLQDDDARLIAR